MPQNVRRCLTGVLALWCLLTVRVPGAGAAQATGTYVSVQYRYSITYPLHWLRLSVDGTDFAALAINRNVIISVSAAPGRAGSATLRAALRLAFKPFGHPAHAPVFGVIRLHGIHAVLAHDLVIRQDGRWSNVVAVAVAHHGIVYTVLGVVPDTRAASSVTDAHAVATVIAGVRLL